METLPTIKESKRKVNVKSMDSTCELARSASERGAPDSPLCTRCRAGIALVRTVGVIAAVSDV